MAASRLRLPVLAFVALSITLSIAIIGCAGRTLHSYTSQQSSNAWLLPIWPNHFDTRGLHALIGTSVAVLVLNAISVTALLITKAPANLIVLASSFISAIVSLIALIFPDLLNNHAPRRDTLQTWTCMWDNATIKSGQGPPSQFSRICHETRFAYYTTIPVFIIQLCLLATACYITLSSGLSKHGPVRSNDMEKGQELGDYKRQDSYDTRRGVEGSPKSAVTDTARILPAKA